MDCDLTHIYRCIDYEFVKVVGAGAYEELSDDMPTCLGRWVSLPNPIPAGSYGTVYVAEVLETADRRTRLRIMSGGKLVAVVKWGETRNWTCVPGNADVGS